MNSKLNIKLESRWLDIPSGTKLKFKWVNNMFFNKTKQRERSLQMNLPLSSPNNLAFEWIFEIGASSSSQTQFECQVYDGGNFVMNATLKVKRTNSVYKIYVLGEWGSLDDLFGNKNLAEMELDVETPSLDETDIANGSFPDYPFWNPAAYYHRCIDAPEDTQELQEGIGLYNYLYAPFASERRGEARHAPYLLSVLEAIAIDAGIKPIESGLFKTDTELKELILLGYARVTQLSGAAPEGYLPNIKIVDFIESIEKLFCCSFLLDLNSRTLKTVFHKETANNTDVIDWTHKLASDFDRDWTTAIQGFSYDWSSDFYSSYEPESVANSYFDWPHAVFESVDLPYGNLDRWYYWGENFMFKLEKRGSEFNYIPQEYLLNLQSTDKYEVLAEYDTYDELPTTNAFADIGKLVFIKSRQAYYNILSTSYMRYRYAFTRFEKLVTTSNNDLIKVEPTVYPAVMDLIGPRIQDPASTSEDQFFELDDNWRIPCVKSGGFLTDGKTEEYSSKNLAQLAFKRGLKERIWYNYERTEIESLGDTYTYASSDEFDPDETEAYNYSLHWEGEKGLYNTWWKDWADTITGGQEVEVMLNLNSVDIANLDLTKAIMLKGAKFYIMEVNMVIPMEGATKVKLLKVE